MQHKIDNTPRFHIGVVPFHKILMFMFGVYAIQIVCGIIIASIGVYMVSILKRILGDFSKRDFIVNPFLRKNDLES